MARIVCLGAVIMTSIGIAYLSVKFKDDRYSSSLVTIHNVTVPGRYCGICDINYCCAVSTTVKLTADSVVRMYYIRDHKRLDVAAVFEQPSRRNDDVGIGCVVVGVLLMVAVTIGVNSRKIDNAVVRFEAPAPPVQRPYYTTQQQPVLGRVASYRGGYTGGYTGSNRWP